MNPLDLPGPQFLAFYAVLFVAAVGAAGFLRRHLREPSDEPSRIALNLSPYEVAYLAGGEVRAVNAAITCLVRDDILTVDEAKRKLTRRREALPAGASNLERTIYAPTNGKTGATIAEVRSLAVPVLAPIRKRLEQSGLLVADDQTWAARVLPLLLVLSVPLFGVIKIFVGISRDRPVGFLIALCVLSVVVALGGFRGSVHRSRRGDRALAQLKEANAAMEFQAGRRINDLSRDDLVLALGLFDMGILVDERLSRLETALRPPPSAIRWNSGCGGGGGCGGCGGGGCGGCGGGGCGG